ncbi:MAG: hypothetical protein SH820_13810 [Xanthomonadales bacterium]|nr:hypothetical protein [Xanthomonadales bacterium]
MKGIELKNKWAAMVCVFVCFICANLAQAEALDPSVQWKDPSSVLLKVDFPGNGYHASWELFRCTCGDLMIRSELNEPGEVVHGDILLVSNRAVLSRGYEENAEELLSFEAPALMLQLALRLLERSEPKGPAAVSKKQKAEVTDEINYINLDTGTAAGGFPAPWSVKGSLSPEGDSKRRFDLKFSFNTGGAAGGKDQQGEMRLSGVAEYAASEFPVADDLDLQPWLLTWRDESDPASKVGDEVKTLGDVRALLKKTPE